MALSQPKLIKTYHSREGRQVYGLLAGVACLQGGLAMLVGGYLRPARIGQGGSDAAKQADVANARVVGWFDSSATGGASDGDVTVDTLEGVILVKNSAGVDAITVADIDRFCFVIDDETVARHSAGGLRPRAGVVREVTSEGVWVEVGATVAAGAGRSIALQYAINETDTLAGTSAEIVCPVAGRISRLTNIIQKAVTTGGDVTVKVNGVTVVGLTITVADAATKGTVQTDTPTLGDATTIVAAGDRIEIVPAAAFNTAGAISGVLEIAH